MNLMSSREMLALSKKTTITESLERQRARPASVDDSVIDDSARVSARFSQLPRIPLQRIAALFHPLQGLPMNAEQIDEKGNWAASNPAYELFCIQAEVHHHQQQHQRSARSPSPDNTEAQMPDMPSEVAMDGDSDSLVNVRDSFPVRTLSLNLTSFRRSARRSTARRKSPLRTGRVSRCTPPARSSTICTRTWTSRRIARSPTPRGTLQQLCFPRATRRKQLIVRFDVD